MSKDTRSENHFNEPKKPHTKIKHLLLNTVLTKSLSIANNLCDRFKYTDKKYTYVDLFAGPGTFDDNSKGSPLIALDIMGNQINDAKNKFDKLQIIATEKNRTHIQQLEETLTTIEATNEIDFFYGEGEWENFDTKLQNRLKNSTWGFIFADPFSTELDILKLKTVLTDCSKLKDILVFFNFNTLARQDGRALPEDIKRICKNLGLEECNLLDNDGYFSNVFEETLKNHFSDLKDFVIGVSFPTTVEGKLINADYFYLVFSTGSIMLVDSFLKAYEQALGLFGGYLPQRTLFEGHDILEYLQNNNLESSLFDLFINFTKNFLSWKTISQRGSRINTIENIINMLNELAREEQIEFECPTEIAYKRKTGENVPGNIKFSAINNKKNLESVKIKLTTSFQPVLF